LLVVRDARRGCVRPPRIDLWVSLKSFHLLYKVKPPLPSSDPPSDSIKFTFADTLL